MIVLISGFSALMDEIGGRYEELCANSLHNTDFSGLDCDSDIYGGGGSGGFIALANNAEFMAHIRLMQIESRLANPGKKRGIDMIYMDPPFYSNSVYKARICTSDEARYVDVYSDRWRSLDEYLISLGIRIRLAHDLLADTGSIFIHLDWHAAHYVKIIADEIFGYDNFINEIIWQYKSGGASGRKFSRKHDTILFYGKSGAYKFNPQSEKSYNRDFKAYRFKNVKEYCDEAGWYTMVNMRDVWEINMVGRSSKERTGFHTQKPEKLLSRIVSAATDEGDLIADFYMGSGTALKVAADSGRKFIGCDMSRNSFEITKKRLTDAGIAFRTAEFCCGGKSHD